MFRIVVDEGKCSGCGVCQLRCSEHLGKACNPLKAAIRIDGLFRGDIKHEFTDEFNQCGICARYCAYGALTLDVTKDGV